MKSYFSITAGSNVIIYGTGDFSRRVAKNAVILGFTVVGFVDHLNVRKTMNINGQSYKVFEIQDLPNIDAFSTLILGIGNGFADLGRIYGELQDYVPSQMICSPVQFAYICGSRGLQMDCYWMQSNNDYYNANSQIIDEAREMFSDEESQNQYLQIIKYREFGDLSDLPRSDTLAEQYLPSNIGTPPKALRMLDLGACKGENLEFFLGRGHTFDFGAFFEPDFSNFLFLANKLRALNIGNSIVLPLAAWFETKLLSFDSTSDASSSLQDSGDSLVQSVKLADFLATTRINFVKMDIEGAEYEALLGLESVLLRDKPHLAISVYHKPDDMWKIGLWLKSLFGDTYNFYLRTYNFQTFDTVLYAVPVG